MRSSSLAGKFAVVTGGSSGIGAAVVQALLDAGAQVLSAALDLPALPPSHSSPLTRGHLDVTDPASVDALFAWVDAQGFVPELVVNAAGIGIFAPVLELHADAWQRVLTTNLTGSVLTSREAVRRMVQAGTGGRLVQIGSIACQMPLAENAAYAASKAGLRSFSSVLNVEHYADGINSTFLTLGAVDTPAWEGRQGFSAQDMLSPSAVADVVVQLLGQPAGLRIDEMTLLPPKGVL